MRFLQRLQNGSPLGMTMLELLVSIATTAVIVGITLPAIQSARESARRIHCRNHFRQVGLALTQYQIRQRCFPSNGNSPWPIAIARELDVPLRDEWNSLVTNRTIDGFAVLQCPSDRNLPTSQGAVSNIAFSGEMLSIYPEAITDGLSNTILAAEIPSALGIAWTEGPLSWPAAIGSAHSAGFHVGLADGSVHCLPPTISEDVLSALFSKDGQEVVAIP